jgi:Flp pilus assembly protein TadD
MAQAAEMSRDRAAVSWRRRVVELEPKSTDDALALANCALQFGDINTAAKTIAAIDATGKQTAGFHATAARLASARKNLAEARNEWREALRLAPNDESYQLQFAIASLQQSTDAEAEEGRRILKGLRNSPTQRAVATRALISDGITHHQDAQELRAFANELQSYPEALFTDRLLYLDILRRLNDPEYAAFLTKIEQDASKKPGELAALLTWMAGNGLSIVAIDLAKSVPDEVLKAWPVPWSLAEAYAKANDWAELERLTTNSNWGGFDFLRRAYLTRAFRAENKTLAAEREWAGATKDASSQAQSLLMLTSVISDWGWKTESIDLLWQLAKYPETQAEALQTLYLHYGRAGDTQGLHRVLLRLFETDPTNLNVQNNLAQTSLLLNANPDQARRLATELYHKAPSNPSYATTYAYALYSRGNVQQALDVMESLTPEQLQQPQIAAYYGVFLARAGANDKAAHFLELANKANLLTEEKELVDAAKKRVQASNSAPSNG